MPKKKNYFISFMGGIASGKTTATELVAKHLDFVPVKERFGKNEFLPLFYKDMKRWALHSQLFFLADKISQLLELKELLKKKSVVLDADINQDFCYVEAQKNLGYIDRREYALYHKIYKSVEKLLPAADLIIYLKTDPKVLEERIKERRRPFEKSVSQNYLKALIRAQEQWLKKNKDRLSIITIDTDGINFARRRKEKERFIKTIKEAL